MYNVKQIFGHLVEERVLGSFHYWWDSPNVSERRSLGLGNGPFFIFLLFFFCNRRHRDTESLVFRNSSYTPRRRHGFRFKEVSLDRGGRTPPSGPPPLGTSARRAARKDFFLIAGALAEQSAPYARKRWKKRCINHVVVCRDAISRPT